MTTTMDTDSESQDSDDGRRFRFEATRKDATTALQARKRKLPSPFSRDNEISGSRDRSKYNRKDDYYKKESRSNYDERRNSSKDYKNMKEESRRKEENSRYRDSKNSSYKESRESSRRDSRSRDSRESKSSRDSKRNRSRERNRDLKNREKNRRHSRERVKSNRDQINSQNDNQTVKNISKEFSHNIHEKITESQDCKDLNLSDFDIVSDTEGNNSDNSGFIKTGKVVLKGKTNLEKIEKVNPQIGGDDNDETTGPSYSNNDDVSDFLLASTSAKFSSHDNENNKLINKLKKNVDCTNINETLEVVKNSNNDDDDDDDEDCSYGPTLPPSLTNKIPEQQNLKKEKIIGPSLPDYFSRNLENDDDEDQDDPFGPALPPHLVKKNIESIEPDVMDTKEIIDEEKNNFDIDDDDDNGFGPLPADHPAIRDDLVQQQLEYRARMIKQELAEIDNTEEKKREEWMTELPSIQAANLGLGPRKFRSKPGPDMSDRSGWTDTPADRAKKHREKIMMIGKSSQEQQPEQHEPMEKPNKRKEKSLLEMHQKKLHKKKKKEDKEAKKTGKPVRRPFDRDVDMQVNRIDESRKKQFLMKSAALDDRFSRGQI